jgi:pimeloyl-ACP methyl ester carboxylesterase
MRTTTRPSLYFTDRGEGQPVLLITGWMISSAVFDPIAHLYEETRIIAHDHRGTGRSERWSGPVSAAVLAADAARVLDELGLEHAHLVGVSLGATVALELAVRMPHRVKSLVLLGGAAGGPRTALPPMTEAIATIATITRESAARRSPWLACALFSPAFRSERPDLVAEYVPYFVSDLAPPVAALWQLVAVACFSRQGSLRNVQAPTLVLHGGADSMVAPANAVSLARAIPGAELHIADGSGHAVPLERPEWTARLLQDWFEAQRDSVPRPSRPRDQLGERVSRPFSLVSGSVRNTRDALALVLRRPGVRRTAG